MVQSIAIIVAGGSGKRMLHDLPKQFLSLDGIPILARTLGAFQKSTSIVRIVLVVPKENVAYAKDEIVDKYQFCKVEHILAGGAARQDSVRNGLELVDDSDDVVVIHDGVRPFISETLIDLSIREAVKKGAVIPVVPVTDTVKTIDENGIVRDTVDRKMLRFVQTPQTFKREIIIEAYRNAYRKGFYGTDDASVVEHMGVPVATIPGSRDNIKITTPEDIILCKLLLEKTGMGI